MPRAVGSIHLYATPVGDPAPLRDLLTKTPDPFKSLSGTSLIKGDMSWLDIRFKEVIFRGFETHGPRALSKSKGKICLEGFASDEILKTGEDLLVICSSQNCLWISPESRYCRLAPENNEPLSLKFSHFNREFFGTSVFLQDKADKNGFLKMPTIPNRLDPDAIIAAGILEDAEKFGFVLVGLGDRIELWPMNRWEESLKELLGEKELNLATPSRRVPPHYWDSDITCHDAENIYAKSLVRNSGLPQLESNEMDRLICQLSAWQTDAASFYAFLYKHIRGLDDLRAIRQQSELCAKDPTVHFGNDNPIAPEDFMRQCQLEVREGGDQLTGTGPFKMVTLPNLDSFALVPESTRPDGKPCSGNRLPLEALAILSGGKLSGYQTIEIHPYPGGYYVISPLDPDRTPPLPGLFDPKDVETTVYSHGKPFPKPPSKATPQNRWPGLQPPFAEDF